MDYNERIAPVIAERALALGLNPAAQPGLPFGVTHPAVERSKMGLYARGYYEQHPCFAPGPTL